MAANEIKITIKFVPSLWTAIKIRIAGKYFIEALFGRKKGLKDDKKTDWTAAIDAF